MSIDYSFDPNVIFSVSDAIKKLFPQVMLGILVTEIQVSESSPEILKRSHEIISQITSQYSIESISLIPAIAQTRSAYRKLGKDPARYRPSAEALCRRIVSGKSLFKINNVVDVLNIISIETGYSIGGYDLDKIQLPVMLAIGREKEPYNAIGRGDLNIHNLPVLYDRLGPFGCPTSDSIRTMITSETKKFMMVIFDFDGRGNMNEALNLSSSYYHELVRATHITAEIIR